MVGKTPLPTAASLLVPTRIIRVLQFVSNLTFTHQGLSGQFFNFVHSSRPFLTTFVHASAFSVQIFNFDLSSRPS